MSLLIVLPKVSMATQMEVQNIATDFIVAYYSIVIGEIDNLNKFYDVDASIWRNDLNSKVGVSLKKAKINLFPTIELGTDFSILSYSILPLKTGFSVSVIGQLKFEQSTRTFSQFFTLAKKSDRYFIVSDSLMFHDLISDKKVAKPIVPANNTAEPPQNAPAAPKLEVKAETSAPVPENKQSEQQKKAKKSPRNRDSKFAPYIPPSST